MDRRPVESREYKLLLRANRFAGDQTAALKTAGEFWRDFCRTIASIVIRCDGDLDRVKTERVITFLDTAKHHLNGSSYIFRERRALDEGKPEVTLKFRHRDRYVSQHRNMDAEHAHGARTKFEEDIKSPFQSLYSFSTTIPLPGDTAFQTVGDMERVFPNVADSLGGVRTSETLVPVNGFSAREIVIEGGRRRSSCGTTMLGNRRRRPSWSSATATATRTNTTGA